ncbi:MAG: DUF1236 domain-containing protein [Hyphomicrobiales bacterium]|nr:DUF1236 domain-containing protein [Hyphomicrobiales bacterium]
MQRALGMAIAALMTCGFALAATAQNTGNSANNNSGPPGAGPQTMPSTMSPANAQSDRTPIMARPLPLTDDQKQRIVAAVGSAPVAQINAKPAQTLPSSVALQDLPPDLGNMPALRGYKYVNLADRVIFVAPASREVVGEIPK